MRIREYAHSCAPISILLLFLQFALTTNAFNAGDPSPALANRTFTHGNIEAGLRQLDPSFFTESVVRKIYFGNFLRDFSQILDRASLNLMPTKAWMPLVKFFGRQEFGKDPTFRIEQSVLGVYQPHEHVDNPKSYNGAESHEVDKRLRAAVEPIEYAIDPESGMKNYIANSMQGWPTATEYIAKSLHSSIERHWNDTKRGPAPPKFHEIMNDLFARTGHHQSGNYRNGQHGARGSHRQEYPKQRSSNKRTRMRFFTRSERIHRLRDFADEPARRERYDDYYHQLFRQSTHSRPRGRTDRRRSNKEPLRKELRLSRMTLVYLGQALHAIEDFYSHSNFVELALRRLGYKQVFPWVGPLSMVRLKNGKNVYPLVTGTFGPYDFRVSLLQKYKDALASVNHEDNFDIANNPDLLDSGSDDEDEKDADEGDERKHSNRHHHRLHRRNFFRDIGNKFKEKVVVPVKHKLASFFITKLERFIDGQSEPGRKEFFLDPYNTDPTHSVISKDHYDHPLNGIAGRCAQYAIMHIGYVFKKAIRGEIGVQEVIKTALSYIIHPWLIKSEDTANQKTLDIIKEYIDAQPELLKFLTYERARAGTQNIF